MVEQAVVEREPALVDERHRAERGHRLRDGADALAQRRILLAATFDVRMAEALGVDQFVAGDHADSEPGHAVLLERLRGCGANTCGVSRSKGRWHRTTSYRLPGP